MKMVGILVGILVDAHVGILIEALLDHVVIDANGLID
jgi:hypothetical protein